jgi:hypothetical protein
MGFREYIEVGLGIKSSINLAAELAHKIVQDFEFSRYKKYLNRWEALLEPSFLRIYSFERIKSNQTLMLSEIAEWLGLDSGFYERYHPEKRNESFKPRLPWLHKLGTNISGRAGQNVVWDTFRRTYKKLFVTSVNYQMHDQDRNRLSEIYRDDTKYYKELLRKQYEYNG